MIERVDRSATSRIDEMAAQQMALQRAMRAYEDLLVSALEQEPRVWTLAELVDSFRDLRVPAELIRLVADRAVESGRVDRVDRDPIGWRVRKG